jgi:hypothetical protein
METTVSRIDAVGRNPHPYPFPQGERECRRPSPSGDRLSPLPSRERIKVRPHKPVFLMHCALEPRVDGVCSEPRSLRSGVAPDVRTHGARHSAKAAPCLTTNEPSPIRGRFMGSLHSFLARIGTMNLVCPAFRDAPPRNVTASYFEAASRAARWVDWFRPATCVLIGDLALSRERAGFPLERLVLFGSWPGTAVRTRNQTVARNYVDTIFACAGSHGCRD